jgi:hypothetical protein
MNQPNWIIIIGFQVLTAVIIQSTIFLVYRVVCRKSTYVSEGPEYGRAMFLRNVGWLSTDYPALYHRIQYSEYSSFHTYCGVFYTIHVGFI